MAERVAARAIVENNFGEVLISQRSPNDRAGAGLWNLSGGKVDDGESPEEAVAREIGEELDCKFLDIKLYLVHTDITDPQNPWTTYYFTGRMVGEIKFNDEIVEVRYVSAKQLDEIKFAFDHKERLMDFFNRKE